MSKARAYTNIALIKYWGKSDPLWNLPTTGSIGLTLDQLYTETSAKINDDLKQDYFMLNGQKTQNLKVMKVMNFLRDLTGDRHFVEIFSENHVPTAAGLASSASGFAALAMAASQAFGLSLDRKELSTIARLGSGSASRSVFGGFSIWHAGHDHDSSFAESILDPLNFDIRVIDILADKSTKKISSSQGMQLAQSAPNYAAWCSNSQKQIDDMLAAIANSDLEKIGLIAEKNALAMHELNRTAIQAFDYFTQNTRDIIAATKKLYNSGTLAFATIDAGPNVKVITNSENQSTVIETLKNYGEILVQKAGPGVTNV
ncbi:diphosphomevalonate decarboxylase [Oenococcus sicerae]|uniref:diphosphomevalonate decarboxylase n=1 Tax=Oenococcus sicerae TaxID=2203724 RepID=A0AAJ1R968_9LACO|nr:diphosphomevalonate decarboxylase [Oenococcus sicerae]MDN6899830.1 diphosphomevalonate decarboxylase [Oenococcus sicerae]QAS70516.1 diphosphomevalonate decarboxylase [Oenococcus sicerae]